MRNSPFLLMPLTIISPDVVVPEISARTYTAGRIQIEVGGFFEIDFEANS